MFPGFVKVRHVNSAERVHAQSCGMCDVNGHATWVCDAPLANNVIIKGNVLLLYRNNTIFYSKRAFGYKIINFMEYATVLDEKNKSIHKI
jgi:hypothetical protein